MSGFPFQGYPVYLDAGTFAGFANTPTNAAAVSSTRPDDPKAPDPGSRVRRQNRSCDQCRKGKRKCDAVILRGWPGDDTDADQPSDTRPPRPCTYCTKTSKNCTFEWLKALESNVRAKKEAAQDSGPPKRTKTGRSPSLMDSVDSGFLSASLGVGSPSKTGPSKSPPSLGINLASPGDPQLEAEFDPRHLSESQLPVYAAYPPKALSSPWSSLCIDPSSQALPFSAQTFSTRSAVPVAESQFAGYSPKDSLAVERDLRWHGLLDISLPSRKRLFERSDDSSDSFDETGPLEFRRVNVLIDPSPFSLTGRLTTSANVADVSKSLLKIYHDSMENALSCWLNARTCPYVSSPKAITAASNSEPSLQQIWAEDFPSRFVQRVLSLDQVVGKIRDRPLTQSEDNAASKAMNLAIVAFASQWAHGSKRSKEEHRSSFGRVDGMEDTTHRATRTEFDRELQEQCWHKARQALMECAEVESFKAVFANMLFSLTHRPISTEQQDEIRRAAASVCETSGTIDFDALEEKVERVIELDGPPIYLERGVRCAHSLRDKLRRLERESRKPGQRRTKLPDEDRQAVDMVAWLGYMIDSLTSAMYQRPLVVSDEDSDILPESMDALDLSDDDLAADREPRQPAASKLWDDFLFLQEKSNRRGQPPLSYPCAYDDAAAGLADAAPIKVLLFRKIGQLQRLAARGGPASRAADTQRDALRVYRYWRDAYEPFLRACAANHDRLRPRIQSWYLCIMAHWHLAGLMLADALEAAAAAGIAPAADGGGPRSPAEEADAEARVSEIRRHDAAALADLARSATPRPDASFAASGRFHAAVSASALLAEAWTELLVRAFAKAALRLLRDAADAARGGGATEPAADHPFATAALASMAEGVGGGGEAAELARQCDWCVGALKFLGRKSDVARLVGDTIGAALSRGTAGWGAGGGGEAADAAAASASSAPESVWMAGEGLGAEPTFAGSDDGDGLFWFDG